MGSLTAGPKLEVTYLCPAHWARVDPGWRGRLCRLWEIQVWSLPVSLGHVVSGIRHVCIYDTALARGSPGRGLTKCWM